MTVDKRLMGVVFADVKGFGSLTESEVARFSTDVLPKCVRLARTRRSSYVNTWGDAIVAFFHAVSDAFEYAFALRDFFRNTDWVGGHSGGFHLELKARISLHAADIFISTTKDVPGGRLFGTQISLAARIEPITVPNEVFASEAAVSIVRTQGAGALIFKNLGVFLLPKEGRRERVYWVRRQGEIGVLKERGAIRAAIGCLGATDEALRDIGRRIRNLHSLKILALNGGSSIHGLLEVLRPRLARHCEISVLVFDTNCTNLESPPLVDGTERSYLDRLRTVVSRNPRVASAACEYLIQASEISAWTNESHNAQIERLRERLSNFAESLPRHQRIVLELRRSPRWMIGRTWLLDDCAYLTLYCQPNKLAPILVSEQGGELFRTLEEHFNYVWSDAEDDSKSLLFRLERGAVKTSPSKSRSSPATPGE